ncbi:MAG: oligosaccharide flippase family protein [Gaiellaceae bacterium]
MTLEVGGEEAGHGGALAAIVRGMAVAMLGSVVGGGLGFVFLVVMGHELRQAEFGLFVLALNLVTSGAQLTIAGADYAAIRFVSAAPDAGAKRGAMATPIALACALNVALALLVFALARPLAVHAFHQPAFTQPLRALALVLPLTVAATMISAAISGLELASGELVRKVVEQAGRIAFAVLAVSLGLGVAGAVLGLAGAAAVATVATGLLLWRALPRGGSTARLPVRDVVAFAWPQTVANGAAQVWWLVTLAFLARYAGARGVAIFGAATALGRLPALVYNSFAYRFTPTISRLWTERKLRELESLLRSVTRWVAITAVPLYAVAIALPRPLLRVFGHDFQGGSLALALIAVGLLVDSLAGPVDRALIMTGHVRLEMAANIACAVVMLGGSFALTRTYGLDGAVIAIVLYNIGLNALKAWFVWWKLHMTPMSKELLGPLGAGAVACGAAALVAAQTSLDSTFPGVVLLVVLLFAVYAALLLGVVGISPLDRSALRLAVRPDA